MRMRFVIGFLACISALLTGCPHGAGQQDLASLPSLTTDNPQAEARLREARDAAESGRSAEAAEIYRSFLRDYATDPLAPVARLGLGRVLLASGQMQGALAEFDRVAASEDPSVAEAGRFYKGVALHLLGRDPEALELLAPLAGQTTDPTETVLLLRSLSAAARAVGQNVVALSAIDQLVRSESVPEEARHEAETRLGELVAELDAAAVHEAYTSLPRDGAAWPVVAVRAIRLAFDQGNMARVSEMVADLRARDVPMNDELAELAVRAERTERADPRVIGAIVPMTGPGREVGQRATRGLMVATGNLADGPPSPEAPQLVLRDDGGNPERAAQAVEDLVSEHRAIAIVGPLESASARAAAERAQALGVPLIALVPNDDLTEVGPMAFRLFASPREEAAALVASAREMGARRFAVLAPAHGYGRAMTDAFRAAVVAAGGELAIERTYAPASTSFGAVIGELVGSTFDALFIPDSGRQLALIAPALAAAGLWSGRPSDPTPRSGRRALLLAPSVAVDARAVQSASRYLQGTLFTSSFYAPTAEGAGLAFVDAFHDRFGTAPDTYAAYAFDAFGLVRDAVERGETTREGVARQLTESGHRDTVGASGGISGTRTPASGLRVLVYQGTGFERAASPSR